MKRILILGVALALVALMAAGLSAAERKGTFGVGVGGGVGIPTGTFGDESKLGWRAGLGFGYFTTDQIAIGAEGTLGQHKAKSALIVTPVTDIKTQLLEFGAWARYFFKMQSEKISPYVKFGVGATSDKAKVTPEPTGGIKSETFMGANIGVGGLYAVSPTASIFLEGGFYDYAKKDFKPINYVAAKVGVAYMFGGYSSGGGGTE